MRDVFDVYHEVPLVPQTTGMSCWAAAAAMLVGWRDRSVTDGRALAVRAGHHRALAIGLHPADLDGLAAGFHLVPCDVGDWTVGRLRSLLARFGPLWVGEASPGLHSVVIVGAGGDGTSGGTWVRVNDPWPVGRGERYRIGFADFVRNFRAASDVVGTRHAQVLHAGGRPATYGAPLGLFRHLTAREEPEVAPPQRPRSAHPHDAICRILAVGPAGTRSATAFYVGDAAVVTAAEVVRDARRVELLAGETPSGSALPPQDARRWTVRGGLAVLAVADPPPYGRPVDLAAYDGAGRAVVAVGYPDGRAQAQAPASHATEAWIGAPVLRDGRAVGVVLGRSWAPFTPRDAVELRGWPIGHAVPRGA